MNLSAIWSQLQLELKVDSRQAPLFRGSLLVELRVSKISLRENCLLILNLYWKSARELDVESELRARARASLRASGRASSLARQKFKVSELALARSPKNWGRPARARSLAEIFANILHSERDHLAQAECINRGISSLILPISLPLKT